MLKIRLRRPAKYRIYFLILMIIVYWLGFNLLPEQLTQTSEQLSLAVVSALYFVLLPLLYWYWIIKIGAQKSWKILGSVDLSRVIFRQHGKTL
ncbi:hypothetical protein A1L58_20750 [Shewanella baltica]|uniref:hypothetical protein n=1 Tax=Shewanella baltica TaxID=62322 RepID=UPI0007B46513|nr:hypothetical protein [Shewanella baltica]KZK67226.1 hypothetical protein A1L58_20750 [Shewanella baltica]